jgi:hypothetical protein
MAQPEKVRQFVKRAPQFEVIQGRRWSEDWKDSQCDLTMEELVGLQGLIRTVAIQVNGICDRGQVGDYRDIFESLERQLDSSQLGHTGLAAEVIDKHLRHVRIICNISRVLPTSENCDMVRDFRDRIIERQAQLVRLHVVRKK